ncbi:hypothetical protein Hdeb2414_s0020g00554961 [Helianthus debilis subsp. tardiflorus]
MITTFGSWKDRFFWVSESIIPFKMIWRHPDAVLNELEPSDSELDNWFLKSIRACPSRLCPFPEHLLVLMGISKLWDKPDRDPVFMRDGQVMSAMEFIKSDDTSDVVFADAASAEDEDVVVRGSKHKFEGSGYVSVPSVKGFVKAPASKQSTRRSTRCKGAGQPSSCETINLGDELEVEDTGVPTDGKKGKLPLVAGKDVMAMGKKVGGSKPSTKAIESSSNVVSGRYMCLTGNLPSLIPLSVLPFVRMLSTILPQQLFVFPHLPWLMIK